MEPTLLSHGSRFFYLYFACSPWGEQTRDVRDYFVIPERGASDEWNRRFATVQCIWWRERDYYMIPEKGGFKIFKPAHCVMRFLILRRERSMNLDS